jgi:hypothetical protein
MFYRGKHYTMPYKDKEKQRQYHSQYAKVNRVKKTAQARHAHKIWREANPDDYKSRRHTKYLTYNEQAHLARLKREYGLTADEYYNLYNAQKGLCAICKKPESKQMNGKPRRLCVDHNHITNKVRGLLCQNCNIALGKLKADEGIELLQEAINYIKFGANAPYIEVPSDKNVSISTALAPVLNTGVAPLENLYPLANASVCPPPESCDTINVYVPPA